MMRTKIKQSALRRAVCHLLIFQVVNALLIGLMSKYLLSTGEEWATPWLMFAHYVGSALGGISIIFLEKKCSKTVLRWMTVIAALVWAGSIPLFLLPPLGLIPVRFVFGIANGVLFAGIFTRLRELYPDAKILPNAHRTYQSYVIGLSTALYWLNMGLAVPMFSFLVLKLNNAYAAWVIMVVWAGLVSLFPLLMFVKARKVKKQPTSLFGDNGEDDEDDKKEHGWKSIFCKLFLTFGVIVAPDAIDRAMIIYLPTYSDSMLMGVAIGSLAFSHVVGHWVASKMLIQWNIFLMNLVYVVLATMMVLLTVSDHPVVIFGVTFIVGVAAGCHESIFGQELFARVKGQLAVAMPQAARHLAELMGAWAFGLVVATVDHLWVVLILLIVVSAWATTHKEIRGILQPDLAGWLTDMRKLSQMEWRRSQRRLRRTTMVVNLFLWWAWMRMELKQSRF